VGWLSSLTRKLSGIDALARQDYEHLILENFGQGCLELALKTGGGLDALANPILRKATSGIPYGVWCGLWPVSSYNVHVERTARGAVIVLSTGFLQAIVDFTYLVLNQVELDYDPQPPKRIPQGDVTKYLLRIAEATQPPIKVFVPPVGGLPGTLFAEFSSMAETRSRLFAEIVRSSIGFAIAHEVAHIRLGHLDRPTIRAGPNNHKGQDPLPEDRRKLVNLLFSWSEEIDADAEALRIMVGMPRRYWDENYWEIPYFGAVVFADLTDAVFKPEGVQRYPHPILRRSAAIGTVNSKSRPLEFPICEPLVRTIEILRYGPEVRADMTALNRIYAWGLEFKADERPRGTIVEGVRVRTLDQIDAFIAADFARARASVAYLGIAARGVSRLLSAPDRIEFAIYYDSFRRKFGLHQEWAEADRLIRLAITDLDLTLELWRRSVVQSNQV